MVNQLWQFLEDVWYIIHLNSYKLKRFFLGKEILLHIPSFMVLCFVFLILMVFIFVLFATVVEPLSILYFVFAIIPLTIFTILIFVPSVIIFWKSRETILSPFEGFFLGSIGMICPFLFELLNILLFSMIFLLFHPSRTFKGSFYSSLYFLSHKFGPNTHLNGFDVAVLATSQAFVSSLWEEGIKFLLVGLFVVLANVSPPKDNIIDEKDVNITHETRYTEILYGAAVGLGMGTISSLLYLFTYETYYDGDCQYCKHYPDFSSSEKWGINFSIIGSRIILATILHIVCGIQFGILLKLFRVSGNLGYLFLTIFFPFATHFFFDLIAFGFNSRLTYGDFFNVMILLIVLLLYVIVASIVDGGMMVIYMFFGTKKEHPFAYDIVGKEKGLANEFNDENVDDFLDEEDNDVEVTL